MVALISGLQDTNISLILDASRNGRPTNMHTYLYIPPYNTTHRHTHSLQLCESYSATSF